MQIERIGPQHQAGSDSLLTAATFFKMRKTFFDDSIDDAKVWGWTPRAVWKHRPSALPPRTNVSGLVNHHRRAADAGG